MILSFGETTCKHRHKEGWQRTSNDNSIVLFLNNVSSQAPCLSTHNHSLPQITFPRRHSPQSQGLTTDTRLKRHLPHRHTLPSVRLLRTMYQSFPSIYFHRFNCGHCESFHGILVSETEIVNLDDPCARCEPNTTAGQERLEAMWVWANLTIPYLTADGDIIMAPRGSNGFPTVLNIRQKGDRYEANVVSQDSAEDRAVRSIYGMESRCID